MQTIRLLISEWDGRYEARRRLKHLRLLMAVSCEISRADRCFFWLVWLSTRSSTAGHWKWSATAWVADSCTRLADSLQQTVCASKFPTLVGQFTQQPLCTSSSSRMRVIYHNWSATKQRPHPQSVAEISHHSVLSGDRIRQCETDQCL